MLKELSGKTNPLKFRSKLLGLTYMRNYQYAIRHDDVDEKDTLIEDTMLDVFLPISTPAPSINASLVSSLCRSNSSFFDWKFRFRIFLSCLFLTYSWISLFRPRLEEILLYALSSVQNA